MPRIRYKGHINTEEGVLWAIKCIYLLNNIVVEMFLSNFSATEHTWLSPSGSGQAGITSHFVV